MSDKYKIAVIGHKSSISIYKIIGAEIFIINNQQESQEKVEEIFYKTIESDYGDKDKIPEFAIIFVEENFYQNLSSDLLEKFAKKALPAVVPVPSPNTMNDEKSFSEKRISRIIEKAIGSDISI